MQTPLKKNSSRWLAVISILCFCVYLSGCSALPTWIADAQSMLPLVISLITGILSFSISLSGKTIPADTVATIQEISNDVTAGLKDLQEMVKEYEATPTTDLLSKIEAAATAVQSGLRRLLTDVSIADPSTQAKIIGVTNLVLTQFEAWMTVIPALRAAPLQTISVKVPYSHEELKALFSATLRAHVQNSQVNAAANRVKISS